MVCGLKYTYGMVCGLKYTYGMVCGLQYTYGMVCGLHYTFLHTKQFQFIADKCVSLHSQIFHIRSYPILPMIAGMACGRTCCATWFPILLNLSLKLGRRVCPSTSACKHTKLPLTLFTRSFPAMSHISSIAMCILIRNIHYCRLAMQSASRSVQYFSEILATNFRLLCL
jgi:hypothetical protein